MKRLIVVAALLLSACHLHQPLTLAQVLTFVGEAQDGVQYSCDVEWLDAQACSVALRILHDASAAAASAPSGWQAAAKAALMREENSLPPDSRIRPYLDALIILL